MECSYCQLLLIAALILAFQVPSSSSTTKRFHFSMEWKNVTRLCHTQRVLTVNGEYPGPTIAVNEGDNVQVTVTNNVPRNTTIHWHGVRQLRTGWADGPAYITQCPIGGGQTYMYNFTIANQRGTLWWHAHFLWQRASVHGAFVIYPRKPFPFPNSIQSHHFPPIIFGEWWNRDVERVENEMMLYGGGPNSSDAYTINGLPGPLYPCSTKDTFIQTVERGKTYLLRIINAALNDELFFAIANHTLTVVEIDAVYTKPFTTSAIMIAPGQTTNVLLTADQLFFAIANHTLTVVEIDAVYTKPFTTSAIMIAPGQTTNVLLTADQVPDSTAMFLMAARPYVTSIFPFNNSTTIGFLKYKNTTTTNFETNKPLLPSYILPSNLPAMEDTRFAMQFSDNLRSLGSKDYPCKVPKTVDKRVFTTVGLNLQDCPVNQTCQGYLSKRFYASMNNQSFIRRSISILESHYHNLTTTFSSNFPENPPYVFNYTGVNPVTENMNTEFGTKLLEVPFGTKLEIVLQDTNFLNPENHPIHVHGHNFFIVGKGLGNFDAAKDPKKYNLVDPPERNTVAVPMGGWAAIRIYTDNPGAWFIHCHLEVHTSWGLATGFIVKNGKEPFQRLLPPPSDLPHC
ncbi:Multicopper oxidase [Handroanthus impetiginosus]|uniref:laccase n=1 Tax=Handroanthus impetiginosus TaxID=429701 RepID=A0A2G9I1N6_9LAMI|nr:Multicopper oxidase [Handroanthus impetiginosus]